MSIERRSGAERRIRHLPVKLEQRTGLDRRLDDRRMDERRSSTERRSATHATI